MKTRILLLVVWSLLAITSAEAARQQRAAKDLKGEGPYNRRIKKAAAALNKVITAKSSLGIPVSEACRSKAYRRYERYVQVQSVEALHAALNSAQAGDLIEVMPGTYRHATHDEFTVMDKHGTDKDRIVVCGPKTAVITGWPYIFVIRDSSYVTLAGLNITTGTKGVYIDNSRHTTLSGLTISRTDLEGVRIINNSNNTVVRKCTITNTGRRQAWTGEGIYVGTNMSTNNGTIDRTSNTQILFNTIGPNVPSEMVDLKENTRGGLILGNKFDGHVDNGTRADDNLLDIKGSGYVVRSNIGVNTREHIFSVTARDTPNSGTNNLFTANTCYLDGADESGVCVAVRCAGGSKPCVNQVRCDQTVIGGSGRVTMNGSCPGGGQG